MNDLISRKDAIDALGEEPIVLDEWKDEYNKGMRTLWAVAKRDIESLPSAELKWIPCSERLPDEREERYWCCSEGGYQFQCRWTNDMYGLGANEYSKWGWHVMDKPQYSRVIAWMPLPKPYEAERKES